MVEVIVTSLENSSNLGKKIAKQIKAKFIETEIKSFPDGDLYLRYKEDIKNKKLIIVESFQANPNKTLLNIIFAAQTAKDLGVKKVILISPYLAFMRQDKRFKDGEAINAQIMAKIINTYIDKFITIDPHLHRIRHMDDIFHIPAKNLSANLAISNFIKKNFKNTIIMGPDWESYQWAEEISSNLGIENTVLEKTRHSSRHVDVMMKNQIDMKDKNVIIVDDIISTGNTMIKAAATAKSNGAKTITAIGVHGLFVENAYEKMARYFDNIYTVNTINHKTNKIDIIPTIVEELHKQI